MRKPKTEMKSPGHGLTALEAMLPQGPLILTYHGMDCNNFNGIS